MGSAVLVLAVVLVLVLATSPGVASPAMLLGVCVSLPALVPLLLDVVVLLVVVPVVVVVTHPHTHNPKAPWPIRSNWPCCRVHALLPLRLPPVHVVVVVREGETLIAAYLY